MANNLQFFECSAPDLLKELAKHVEKKLISDGLLKEDDARNFGVDTAKVIAKRWGGQNVYIPKNLAELITERDYKVYQEFNGRNIKELARKFNLSEQWIYSIISRVDKIELRRRQPDLFS